MAYTVLARRYRSETFDQVIGQEAVVQTLKNAIINDRVAHAYLFTGTRGVGKTTMARVLAKSLNCLAVDKPTITPCCECESCQAIARGDDIDVIEVDGASNTGVENIRDLRQNAIYKPARARFKIYIIDEVHMLSTSAFNALLKTLEEPPEHVKFIFATTEPNKILPTILSRCQRFDFRNISRQDIAKQLHNVLKGEGITADDDVIYRIARLAKGSMRDALSLLDQLLSISDGKLSMDLITELLGTPRSEHVIALVDALLQSQPEILLTQLDTVLEQGMALEQLAESLQGYFRDLMVLRNCGVQTDLVEQDDPTVRKHMLEQATKFDDSALVYYITVMEQLRHSLKATGAGRALVEAALVRICTADRFSDTKKLLEQLNNLQLQTSAPMQYHSPAQQLQSRTQQIHAQTQSSSLQTQPLQVSSQSQVQQNIPELTKADVSDSTGVTGNVHVAQPINKKVAGDQTQAINTGVNIPDSIDLNYLQANWQSIISQLRHYGLGGKQMYLSPARVSGWKNGLLSVGYDPQNNGLCKALQAQQTGLKEIESALTSILNRPVKLELVELKKNDNDKQALNNNMASANVAAGSTISTQPPTGNRLTAPGAKPNQQQIQAAMNDHCVQEILEIIGGKVCRVQKLAPGAD